MYKQLDQAGIDGEGLVGARLFEIRNELGNEDEEGGFSFDRRFNSSASFALHISSCWYPGDIVE